MNKPEQDLAHAPDHIKLAIDLIMLLEQQQIDNQTVLDALAIVKSDFENKLTKTPS